MIAPKEIRRLYKSGSLLDKVYINLRWLLCPFDMIERHTPKSGNILDIGCGQGLLVNYLAIKSKKRSVIGIDLSKKRLALAKKTTGKRKNVKFLLKKVEDLKFKEYDCITMSDVLHHLNYKIQEDMLNNVHKGLKVGGKLIILDIDKKPKWKFLFAKAFDYSINDPSKRGFYRSVKELKNILTKKGFKVEVIRLDKNFPLPDILYVCIKTTS